MNDTDAQATPLHVMNPLNRFSDRAADYAKYRPSYPEEAIATILEGLGDPSQLVAADIGAGTGISSRLLAQKGCV
jgi:2-polyprenyl-3-methyl-5-hydroxy-6-metoxy-1,4-benzoquinol methylase